MSLRVDRQFTRRELARADWLQLCVATAGLSGDVNLEQEFDHRTACPKCGVGAAPVGPLLAQLSRIGKEAH